MVCEWGWRSKGMGSEWDVDKGRRGRKSEARVQLAHSYYRSEAMVIGYIEQFVPNIYFLWVQCRPYNLLLNCFCRRKVKNFNS